MDQASENMAKDSKYAPYCMRCKGYQRMVRVSRFRAECPKCTAVHEIEPYWAMAEKEDTPKVGVGIIVKKIDTAGNDAILLGLRKGSHGAGYWSLPGGHMQIGEGFWGVCSRELREETGLRVTSINPAGFTNDDMAEEGLHYVTLYFEVTVEPGEPQLLEPDKCEQWEWWNINNLPNNIWEPIRRLVNQGSLEGVIQDGH